MKSKLFFSLFIILGGIFFITCTHDDELVTSGPKINRGNGEHLPGAMTAGNPAEWKFDKSHSSVLWQTIYVGASGMLVGRFNQFGVADITDVRALDYTTTAQPVKDSDWAFYESDPSKSFFNGYVQTNTSNTGEPGRDASCNLGNMGTSAIVTGIQNLNVANLAKIKTRDIKFDPASNDYLVNVDFTWKGKLAAPLTKTLPGKLKYIPKSKVQFGTAAAYEVFGLVLEFEFNCRDFGVTSTNVHDIFKITCNANFHNK